MTVRELPFAEQNGKNDADSYIHCKEDYSSLKEKHFIVWLAQKRFCIAGSLMEERKYVAEIADLLRYVKDQLVLTCASSNWPNCTARSSCGVMPSPKHVAKRGKRRNMDRP